MRGSKGSKAPESDSRPKAAKGSQGFLRPQEGPMGLERPREAQGVRESKGSKASE